MSSSSPNQAILIVGGGLGIGFSVTKSILATSLATTKVVVFGLHVDPELASLSEKYLGRLFVVLGDVTSAADRAKAMETCRREMGGVDTLVYCAGVLGPVERFEKLDLDLVKRTFDVNVFGAIAMTQQCLPHLRHSAQQTPTNVAHGKILILSSACDATVTCAGWTAYSTSKAALTRFVQLLAHEEPALSIQGVYPRLTQTRMTFDILAGRYRGVMAEHEVERFRVRGKMGLVEPPERCGEAVALLALGRVAGVASGQAVYYDLQVPDEYRRGSRSKL